MGIHTKQMHIGKIDTLVTRFIYSYKAEIYIRSIQRAHIQTEATLLITLFDELVGNLLHGKCATLGFAHHKFSALNISVVDYEVLVCHRGERAKIGIDTLDIEQGIAVEILDIEVAHSHSV